MEQIMINKHHKKNNILSRMHKEQSQTILSKNKQPQVRIIHIFAPEIIKTDPANFMELVQRLTGKSNSSPRDRKRKNYKSARNYVRSEGDHHHVEVVKREEAAAGEIWRSSSSSAGSGNDHESAGGFLDGFGDMDDGFMHQLGPFQPADLLPHNNHNPVIMHQQQQYHFFGGRGSFT
ncbi:hypothetical protein QQ045_028440 [Rhodiola kirilowii]